MASPVSQVLHDARDGAIYAGLNLGHFGVKLHRSDDGGESWNELPAPVYPEKPADLEEPPSIMGTTTPWRLIQIWCLEAGGKDQPGVIWCGTIPGGLFKSNDRGESWQIVDSLWRMPERAAWFGGGADYPGIHSICVDPRDSKHVTIGVSCGGVWETLDGGDSWRVRASGMWASYMPPEKKEEENAQDPHRIVQCAANPDALWCQHHNGVFKSVDAAASWQEVKVPPSSFGFGVAVHPADPNTAWFVPAQLDEIRLPVDSKVVVARTRNGGESFDVLRNGLPQDHAYDLFFRHCLDIAPDGETLAIGSTTGGLWITEDQGDSWQEVSVHLPPIYQVRFAA
jgi:hypothetical protein